MRYFMGNRIKVEVFSKLEYQQTIQAGGEEWIINPSARNIILIYPNEYEALSKNTSKYIIRTI